MNCNRQSCQDLEILRYTSESITQRISRVTCGCDAFKFGHILVESVAQTVVMVWLDFLSFEQLLNIALGTDFISHSYLNSRLRITLSHAPSTESLGFCVVCMLDGA